MARVKNKAREEAINEVIGHMLKVLEWRKDHMNPMQTGVYMVAIRDVRTLLESEEVSK